MNDDGAAPQLVVQDWPPVAGRPGLAQGRYGQRGNLELVVPAVDDGLWVGWFNTDLDETFTGAAVQRWSGALRFAPGHRYVSADVTQVDAGPDHLEVVALTDDGTLRRHVWSPQHGFVDHGALAVAVACCSALVQDPARGDLHVATVGHDGRVRLLWARAGSTYPSLAFDVVTTAMSEMQTVAAAWHDDHLDLVTTWADQVTRWSCATSGTSHETGAGVTGRGAGAVAATRVRLGSHDDEHVITRRGTRLWHRTVADQGPGVWSEHPVGAEVWRPPDGQTGHHGAGPRG